MSEFRRYEKVERIEKSECEGVLSGRVHVFEKLDGANASAWMDDEGRLCVGSRNRQLSCGDGVDDGFRGLVDYVRNHQGIRGFLEVCPRYHLCGEWLVKHTVDYPIAAYNRLYVFDVYDAAEERYLAYEEYAPILERNGIEFIPELAVLTNPTIDQLREFVGKTQFGIPQGEGIVAKNYGFVNQRGNCVYGKMVRDDFKEVNHLLFTASTHDELEVRIVSQYVTEARVRKQVDKLIDVDPDTPIEMRCIPQIMGLVFHDLIAEDIWDILKRFKNPAINFGRLKKLCDTAAKSYFIDLLTRRSAGGAVA